MKIFNIKTFLSLLLVSTFFMTSCGEGSSKKSKNDDGEDGKDKKENTEKSKSGSKYSPEIQAEIDRITANLTQPDSYCESIGDWWVNDGADGYTLTRIRQEIFHEDGTWNSKWIFSMPYSDIPCASVEVPGPWEINYDKESGFYMLDDTITGDIKSENLGMAKRDFDVFDTDMRLWFYGDARDVQPETEESEESDNSYTPSGLRIVNSTPDVLLVQDLKTGEGIRFERHSNREKVPAAPNFSFYEEGDAQTEFTYKMEGMVGQYPLEMELDVYEDMIIGGRERYTQTGSGEWIELNVEQDDITGLTIISEGLPGQGGGVFIGQPTFNQNGRQMIFEGGFEGANGNTMSVYLDGNRM